MGNPAGVRRDFAALEARRMEAARLLRQGLSQSQVARVVGVHRQSVSRWAQELEQSGVRGLRQAKRTGRPPKLNPAQLRDLERALQRGPEAFGFASGLWTASRVRAVIEYRTGVRYHEDHVWRILRKLNWSCQRPSGKALERDEQAIRQWKRVTWPRIKKSRCERRTIVFIDESGVNERPHRVRTWAPRGQTPVLQHHFNWKVLSAAAGITWWNFYFRLYPGAIHAAEVIDCDRLPRPSAAPPAGQAAGGLGRAAAAPGAAGHGVYPRAAGPAGDRALAGLRAGAQPGRIYLGLLETPRTAQLLPARFRPAQLSGAPRTAPHAPSPTPGALVLAASKSVTMICRSQ